MAFKVEGVARVAFTNVPGAVPQPPDNGELKVQQADGLLVTRRQDGSPRFTDLRSMAEQIENGPLALALGEKIARESPSFTGLGRGQGFSVYRGNTPYEGSLGMLNEQPDATQNNNFAKASQNNNSAFRGTAAAPDMEASYARTASFIEHHCATALSQAVSVWGNPYKIGAQVIEFIAEPGFQGEGNGLAARAYSAYSPASTDHFRKILVGASAIAQTNPGNGNPGFDTFGVNVVSARTSGNPGENTVGIENDILLNASVPNLAPGDAGVQNATAYWAQAGQPGIVANTGFLLTATGSAVVGGPESGWLYGVYSNCSVYNHLIFMRNPLNAPSARGARFETQWGSPEGRVLECFRGGDEQLRVDGAGVDPVWIRVGSQLRKLTVVARQNLQDNMFVVVAV